MRILIILVISMLCGKLAKHIYTKNHEEDGDDNA